MTDRLTEKGSTAAQRSGLAHQYVYETTLLCPCCIRDPMSPSAIGCVRLRPQGHAGRRGRLGVPCAGWVPPSDNTGPVARIGGQHSYAFLKICPRYILCFASPSVSSIARFLDPLSVSLSPPSLLPFFPYLISPSSDLHLVLSPSFSSPDLVFASCRESGFTTAGQFFLPSTD